MSVNNLAADSRRCIVGEVEIKMMDLLFIGIAILVIMFILKVATKILKVVLVLAVIVILLYFLTNFGFLKGLLPF